MISSLARNSQVEGRREGRICPWHIAGKNMKVHFSPDDRSAIDLVLRQLGDGQGFVESPAASLRQRMEHIQRILGLLAYLPAVDPPTGLVDRTVNCAQGRADAQKTNTLITRPACAARPEPPDRPSRPASRAAK
jgi:hypothetical protein